MSGWGQDEWPTAQFSDANARRVAEQEAEQKARDVVYRRVTWVMALFGLVLFVAALVI